ncbi:hypothetical protein WJ542_03620 [Paraburkholderia sp. B3]|uniref:hypothetical protein n=1 Tax=Paraburkholderia sp. B3 TaxID=3134791 RepID=UPI003981B3E3
MHRGNRRILAAQADTSIRKEEVIAWTKNNRKIGAVQISLLFDCLVNIMSGNHFNAITPHYASDRTMPYLKNALGGFGRSVTDTARLALAQASAAGWRKLAVYAAVFALPGGSLAVLLFMWAQRRRAKRAVSSTQAARAIVAAPLCADRRAACRAACAQARAGYTPRTRAGAYALDALRRWRRNRA